MASNKENRSTDNNEAAFSIMAAEVRRDSFKNFWDKYSDRPDTNTMMLNQSAEGDLESLDRADILASLPHLTNKDVVDIGAGIGRFTTVLAETARWVLSTDFIESFIQKNQERNAHMGNINYQVGDAVNLSMEDTSVDLVFTNWLMMYLSDSETVEFIFNCMRWLRPNGYVHLRESCSEPSTARSKVNTMHDSNAANPTHYRFSSLYINLLRHIRYRDTDGKLWRFDVNWSCSVPTYIKLQNNWRQVHWLAQKVPAELGEKETTFNELLESFSKTWKDTQKEWDAKLDHETYAWTDEIFSSILSAEKVPRNSTVYIHTPRRLSPFVHINSHRLAEQFTCNVWNSEIEPYYYRTSLTKANAKKDQKVRFGWNASLHGSLVYWRQRDASFDIGVTTELLATATNDEMRILPTIFSSGAHIYSLEPSASEDLTALRAKAATAGMKIVEEKDVTDEAHRLQNEYYEKHGLSNEQADNQHWTLFELAC